MLETLKSSDLEIYLNQTFNLVAPDSTQLTATLTEIKESTKVTKDRRTPFSAIFLAQTNEIYSQGIFHISRDSFGPLDIFMVPIGQNHHGIEYEAVFS